MVTAAGGNPPPNVADLQVVTRSSAHEFQTLAENVHKFFKGEEHGEEAVVA